MEQEFIERINALARKAKEEGLSPVEAEEQKRLRAQYIQMWRKSVQAHLDNIYYVDEAGNKQKLKKKEKKD